MLNAGRDDRQVIPIPLLKRAVPKSVVVIGIDPSFTACGIASVLVSSNEVRVWASEVISTPSEDDYAERLWAIHSGVREFVSRTTEATVHAIEGFAYGAKFNREAQGMVYGACLVALRVGGAEKIEIVTPAQAKKIACPDFAGWSKDKWAAAGYTTKFKRSMPEKATILSGLRRRYGFAAMSDAVGDAVCVAIAAGYKRLEITV